MDLLLFASLDFFMLIMLLCLKRIYCLLKLFIEIFANVPKIVKKSLFKTVSFHLHTVKKIQKLQ